MSCRLYNHTCVLKSINSCIKIINLFKVQKFVFNFRIIINNIMTYV